MSQEITQEGRIIEIDTPLGKDVLLLRSITGTEGISQLFRFHLDMASTNFNISFDDIVGKNVTVKVKLLDDSHRYFNGHISRFAQLPVEGHLAHYEAEMVPWFWFLTRTADCQIFQEKAVGDIIEEVFSDLGFSDYKLSLQKPHPTRVYCVQYRETAANFVMRLMEEEGIFYYFKHEEGKHRTVRNRRSATSTSWARRRRGLKGSSTTGGTSTSCAPASTPSPTTTSKRPART